LTLESHWLGAIAFTTVALVAGASHDASAQPYPQRPVTLINPSAAGGSNEALKTIIFDRVAAALGKPIVMESRSGAGGAIAASFVAKAEPNGYTLFLAGSSVMGSNPATKKDLPYDAVRDFTPIVILVEAPLLLVTHRSIPVTGAREFVDLLRAQPGRLNYGSYGSGTTNFLAYELFKNVTGTDVLHVPYRGSAPLLTALMAAEVDGLRVPPHDPAPRRGGHVQDPRRGERVALPAAPRRANARRARHRGRGGRERLAGGTRGPSGAGRRPAQRRGQQGAGGARGATAPRRDRLRGRGRHARAGVRQDRGRHRQMDPAGACHRLSARMSGRR
jgi:hypothetical protein